MSVKKILIVTMMLILTFSFLLAREIKVSLAQMPVYAESRDKGVLVDFVKAMDEKSDHQFTIEVVPFARSMNYVKSEKVDFHMPLIKLPDSEKLQLDYDHSTATIFHVNFVLYTNKEKPLNKNKLGDYKIETDRAHTAYFDFPITPSSDLLASLKRLNSGRIDGVIFADNACDPIIKTEKFENIRRELYKRFDVKIILPKGNRGGDIDNILTDLIEKLKATGEFDKIMGVIDAPYNNWQP